MSEKVEVSLALCECCGNPIMILRGAYLQPEALASLGLKLECAIPQPGVRVHEFRNPAQARVKYAEYLEGLKPHYEKAYAVLTLKSKARN